MERGKRKRGEREKGKGERERGRMGSGERERKRREKEREWKGKREKEKGERGGEESGKGKEREEEGRKREEEEKEEKAVIDTQLKSSFVTCSQESVVQVILGDCADECCLYWLWCCCSGVSMPMLLPSLLRPDKGHLALASQQACPTLSIA